MSATKDSHIVKRADLPLCCPLPADKVWDKHPRIYLPIEEEGSVVCPYCSASYTLES